MEAEMERLPGASRPKPGAGKTAGLLAAALIVSALAQAQDRGETRVPQASEATSCCFTNPRYSGVCVVEPGADETCASILAYLNNPQSQGKSYCGSTSVRGGWRQGRCKK
jgi:hypothetical protein